MFAIMILTNEKQQSRKGLFSFILTAIFVSKREANKAYNYYTLSCQYVDNLTHYLLAFPPLCLYTLGMVTNDKGDEHTNINSNVQESEADLAKRYPADYSKYVDGDPWNFLDEHGIRHVVVKDHNIEVRYKWENGQIKPAEVF